MLINELREHLNKQSSHSSSFACGLTLFLVDALVMAFSFGLSFFIINIFESENINFKSFINYSVYIPFILLLFACNGLYPGIMNSPTEEVKRFSTCTFFSCLAIIFSLLLTNDKGFEISSFLIKDSQDIALIFAFILTIPIATLALRAFREFAKHLFQRAKWWGVSAVIYGDGDSYQFIVDKLLRNKYLGYNPAIIIDSSAKESYTYNNIPVFPPSQEVFDLIKEFNIKQAVICNYQGDMSQVMSSYRYTTTVSKNQTNFTSTQQLKDIAGIIGFASIHNLTFKGNLFLKRLLDIFIVLFFSPLWIPIMLLLAILTKLTSKGPVFYGHKRIGKNGKEIKCWKFRSMCVNSQEMLEEILKTDPVRRAEWEKDRKFIDDPRVTKFGKILRKTSLDELPQLFNILSGSMSLVGPRPVTEPELKKYGKYKDYVLSVSPGLSGMWQISGRSDTGYEERISFDTYYIQNWSIWLDIWILIKTVWVVLRGKGAY